jgi:hypothetical protein
MIQVIGPDRRLTFGLDPTSSVGARRHHPRAKKRLIRLGDEISDDEEVVVRGGELEANSLRADALRSHAVYGTYSISVFALRDATLDELAQESPLIRFAHLTLTTAREIRSAGLRLEPTGRNRHYFSVVFDDLEDGVASLRRCHHQVWANPYHRG